MPAASKNASKKLKRAAGKQEYHFVLHRRGKYDWNDLDLINSNAGDIVRWILNTPDDSITIFAHSTGSATVIEALRELKKENDKLAAGEKPKRVDKLIIYAGTATRDPKLKKLLIELVDETIILRGSEDTVVGEASKRKNADRKGVSRGGPYNHPCLGETPMESPGKIRKHLLLEGSGVRSDRTKWKIVEEEKKGWNHVTPWVEDRDTGRQIRLEEIIRRMGLKVPPTPRHVKVRGDDPTPGYVEIHREVTPFGPMRIEVDEDLLPP